MRARLSALVALVGGAAAVASCASSPEVSPPVLSVAEATVDFGAVPAGETARRWLRVSNTGDFGFLRF